ncbi:MAG: hypothetical protein ACI94Y_003802 [Maribacter sp.]|jgi:hypothetical protein
MKKIGTICIITLFLLSVVHAQDDSVSLEKDSSNIFMLNFKEYNHKNLELEWKRHIKSYEAKAKKNKKTKEFLASDVIIEEVSSKPLNIYAAIIKDKKGTKLKVWYELDNVFISLETHKKEVIATSQILSKFHTDAVFNEMQRKLKIANKPNPNKLLKGKSTIKPR